MRDSIELPGTTLFWREQRFAKFEYGVQVTPWSEWTLNTRYLYSEDFLRIKAARENIQQGDRFTPTPYRAYRREITPGLVDYPAYPIIPPNSNLKSQTVIELRWVGMHTPKEFHLGSTQTGQTESGYPGVIPSVKARSEHRAYAAVQQQKVNLSQTLGEAALTGGTMARQIGGLWMAFRALRRGQVNRSLDIMKRVARNLKRTASSRDFRRILQRIDDRRLGTPLSYLSLNRGLANLDSLNKAHLAYRYGWAPLVRDIMTLRTLTLDIMSDPSAVAHARGTAEETWDTSLTNLSIERGSVQYITTTGYSFRVTDSELYSLGQLGKINPLATSWELVSYSFVVDWFTGIGDFLRSLSVPLQTEWVHGYQTHVAKGEGTTTVSFAPLHGNVGNGRYKAFAMERNVLAGYPYSGPYIRLDLNINQAASILQLSTARLR